MPWGAQVDFIAPCYCEGKNGRWPFAWEFMLHVHFMPQWFSLPAPAIEGAFFGTPLYREFAQFDARGRLPDKSSFLCFCHRLKKHKLIEQILATANAVLSETGLLLKAGTAVDATPILTPSSTESKDKTRDPEGHAACALLLMDGAGQVAGDAGMSAPANQEVTLAERANAVNKPQIPMLPLL